MDTSTKSETFTQQALNSEFLGAVQDGKINSVLSLLFKGADINARDRYNNTALISAASLNQVDLVAILIKHRALEINAVDSNGCTALMRAAQSGYTKVVSILVSHLPTDSLNLVDNLYGQTALMHAVEAGHTSIAWILIEAGADVTIVAPRSGYTALRYASFWGDRDITLRLLSAMPFQKVLNLQNHPHNLDAFSIECREAVLDIQKNMFYLLATLRHVPALRNGLDRVVASQPDLYPKWYQHRIKSDITLMSAKLNKMLSNRTIRASAAVALAAPLIASIAPPARTFSPARVILTRSRTRALTSAGQETGTELGLRKKARR